jgi:hypothetical protein
VSSSACLPGPLGDCWLARQLTCYWSVRTNLLLLLPRSAALQALEGALDPELQQLLLACPGAAQAAPNASASGTSTAPGHGTAVQASALSCDGDRAPGPSPGPCNDAGTAGGAPTSAAGAANGSAGLSQHSTASPAAAVPLCVPPDPGSSAAARTASAPLRAASRSLVVPTAGSGGPAPGAGGSGTASNPYVSTALCGSARCGPSPLLGPCGGTLDPGHIRQAPPCPLEPQSTSATGFPRAPSCPSQRPLLSH